ncbi:carboxypeptidase regulatory-like domain-containing protein [Muricauda sp. 2012CJ35-5]|uniref:Carboxypeptidase regulatory-like domain-containing protein n=1 Tax=Flagellimonas spongiicola TaxID=2942208 RepID=A0ABT0PNU1_9FLAO|nr:carboxypeptidase regulatory-like domain-containing protein [Allomuricauda spongiicola]MCL6272621.1 carboxypeptidase regulatory-like domain-containing protein [Allomuricauda spongiicola]
MKNRKLALSILFFFSFLILAYSQGVTTSSIGGRILDGEGEPLLGTNIKVTHLPSGTLYGGTTDFDGYFRISGMRPGGPYKVEISYVGFNDYVEDSVYLQLGEAYRINRQLLESATELEGVVITAQSDGVFNSNRTGAETNISNRLIQTIPAASRSIADFVRLTPQAQIQEGNDGFSVSLGGQNNRYNAIYIDGAINNDVFGLAGSGTNGGQTGVNPFSVDAIESFQIQLAPFDVRIAGFSGGSISAVTRSGTNDFQGSAYYFFRNQGLVGKTPHANVPDGGSREKLADFSAKTYGFRLGGPLVEDKLFFFVNYERQDDETPQPFDITNYVGDTDAQGLADLSSFLQNTYGYNPGGYDNNTRTLTSDKVTAKLDWNVDANNKLSLRHSYVKADNLESRTSSNFGIGFINGSEIFKSITNSTALEWNARIGNRMANKMVIGYTKVRDDRDPSGDPFPSVDIFDGSGRITFGAEPFSTANLLNQDVFTFTNNFEIYSGKHTVTLGTHNEYAKVKNLFFAFNYGDYTYNNVADFINNENINFYQHGYSLVGDGTVGDESAGASEFNVWQLGFYAQDEIQVTENFKMTAGLRFDFPIWEDGTVNDDFNSRTIPLLTAEGKDLQGAQVGKGVNTSVHVSPRLGFNWDVNGDRQTQIRGGWGMFTSRLPLVWPGGTYNNNGITSGFAASFNLPDDVVFTPDVNNQPVNVEPGTGGVGGNVDMFAEDFKLPKVWKANLAVDQKLPFFGLVGSVEGIYNKNINAVFYQNLNIRGPVGSLNGADNRPIYDRNDRIDRTYGGIFLASNTSEGSSWNFSATLSKPFENGFAGSISYSYGDARAIFDGTSSQNSSQWRNMETVNGKNSNIPLSRSDFSPGHRIVGNFSYQFRWTDNLKTTLALFYDGNQASPFSYIYQEGADLLNDDSRDNALIFVPQNSNEITLVESNGLSPAEQWSELDAFIESNGYLRSRRGQYVERNGDRGPWSHVIDLKFIQDFKLNLGGNSKHSFQFTADIFNFTNMLNKDWGQRKFVSDIGLLRTESGGEDPTFSFNPTIVEQIEQIDDVGIQSSRWQMQLGLRYSFN